MGNNNDTGNLFKNIGNTVDSMRKISKKLMETLEPIIEGFNNVSEKIGDYLFRINEEGKISDQFNIILLELGFPPIRVLDISYQKTIVELSSNNEKEYMINYIDIQVLNNLSQEYVVGLLKDWKNNKLLKDRIPIMEELINHHINENFFGSTILAVSQIEGIIADGFYHDGQLRGKKIKNYISDIKGNGSKDEAFQRFINEIVLAKFEHRKEIDSYLSRHAIMHGADKTYGNFLNSIKSILLLDYLQDRFKLFYIEDSKILHQYGCRYLEKTNKKIIGTRNIFELIHEDYNLCKVCRKDNLRLF